MKLIIAFLQPFKLDAVRDAAKAAGASGMSVTGIQGFGRQSGQVETYRGAEYEVDFVPKIRIEILTDDHLAPGMVDAIVAAARTGAIGDGKLAVIDVEDVIRIRTGERGSDAL